MSSHRPFCRKYGNVVCFYVLNNIVCSFFCLFLCFSWLLKSNMWWDPEKRFCLLCDCSPVGSVSPQCDAAGRCVCKSGFVGKQCNLGRQVHRQEEHPRRAQPVLGSPRRWGSSSSSGCPRGAYWPAARVIPEALHGSCLACYALCAVADNLWCHFTKKWLLSVPAANAKTRQLLIESLPFKNSYPCFQKYIQVHRLIKFQLTMHV